MTQATITANEKFTELMVLVETTGHLVNEHKKQGIPLLVI